MTRKLKNKIGYKLNGLVSVIQKRGANVKVILSNGFAFEYQRGQENNLEQIIDAI